MQDDRLKALYAAQAAQALFSPGAAQGMNLGGQSGAQAIGNAAQGNAGIDFKIGIGGSSASSTTTSHDETTYGSRISSNGNVTIAAAGGDLNIIGSQISGDNIALAAQNNINLLSQAENHTLQSDNQNVSGGVGILIGSSGFGIYAEASGGQGNAHGNGVTHTDSTVNANGTLMLISGNDTTIKGAQVTGETVLANIGGNLLIQSEQDTDDYASKQWQAGGQVVIGPGGGGGSLSYNQTNINSHYASVTDVSGISAGSGGFDITVGGNTHLIGGVIASSADPSNNVLNTGSLTYEGIHNEANYSASSIGVSGGYGGNGFSGSPSLGIPQKGNSSSDTNSGIAQGTIIVRDNPNQDLSDLDRNPTLDNQALAPIFDLQKVQENLEAGKVAGQVGMTAAGDLESELKLAPGSAGSVAIHAAVGAAAAALGGGNALQGALGAGASESASGVMGDYLANHGVDPNSAEGQALMNLGSTTIGGIVGGGAGASTALAGNEFNRQLHPDEQQLAQTLAANSNGSYTTQQIEDAMRLSGYGAAEPSGTGMLVSVADSGSIYDPSASWQLIQGPGGAPYLMQQVPAQVSPDLANYIIANTGGATSPYSWAPEQEGLPNNQLLSPLPDYAALTGAYGPGALVLTADLHDGQVYLTYSGNAPAQKGLAVALTFGAITTMPSGLSNSEQAAITDNYLVGGSVGGTYCDVLCGGINHSLGGDTAVEGGVGLGILSKTPSVPGASGSLGQTFPIFVIPGTPGAPNPGGGK